MNKLDGVAATVNFATERATVDCDPSVTLDDLVGAVESAGYHARPAGGHDHLGEPASTLERRLLVAIVLTVPVALLAMVPGLEFSGWEWVALVLSTPVILWSGLSFHRTALEHARTGTRRWTR